MFPNIRRGGVRKESPSELRSAPMTKVRPEHWAVVGGGMMGLYTAWRLVRAGQRVTVLEASDQVGGLTSSWQIGGIHWDRFYHVILQSDSALRGLLQEISLDQHIEWTVTRTGFYNQGNLYSLSSSLDYLRFPLLGILQKSRLAATILYASRLKNPGHLERISVESWLRRWSGDSTFEKIWLPLLKAKLGDAYQRTSALFIWATINRMYQARRSGMKREMFGYIPGGYRQIVDTLHSSLAAAGVNVYLNSPVHEIEPGSSKGFKVEFRDRDQPRSAAFDRVVLTIPSPQVSKICPGLSQDEHWRLNSLEYLGVICTSLLLDQPLGGFYVTNIIDPSIPLTGVIEMGSVIRPDLHQGKYLVYLPRYLLSSDEGFTESDSHIHDRCLSTLAVMYPGFHSGRVHAIQTARARHVMTLPTLDYSEKMPSVASSIPGLYVLNSAQIKAGCLNVNEIIEVVQREWAQLLRPEYALV